MNEISYNTDPTTGDPIATLEGNFQIMELKTILRALLDMTGRMPSSIPAGSFALTPIVSGETGEPRIELQAPALDAPLQLGHAEAVALAHALIEVAASAINDAILFGWLVTELGIQKPQAAAMLEAMREYRDRKLSNGKESDEHG